MEKAAAPKRRFLARWARRKTAAAAAPVARPAAADAVAAAAPAEAGALAPAGETAPTLTDADMPPVDSLDADSDFSGFLSPGVSEALRRRALRKLFSSAIFNHRDGLDDYDDDFRHFPALGAHITSDMKHRMEMEAERAEAEAAAAESAGESDEAGDEKTAAADADSPDESPEAADSRESPTMPESPADSPAPTR